VSTPHTTLVDVAGLRALLDGKAAGGVLLLDCRHRLGDPEAGRTLYRDGHLPGAVFADLDRDLAGEPQPNSEGHAGRHPLPTIEVWLETLAAWGLAPDVQAVAYDDVGGAFAARAWWMLQAVGHRPACVLDGGHPAWTAAREALEHGEPTLPRPEAP